MHSIITTALGLFLLSGPASANTPVNLPAMKVEAPKTFSVAMTGYNAVPEQTDGEPNITASGAFSNPDIIAARSADLAAALPFGTVIEIVPFSATSSNNCGISSIEPFIGFRVIADSMHSRKRNQIDVLFDSDVSARVGGKSMNPAVTLGRCSDVTIRVVGFVDVKKIPKSQIELMKAIGFAAPLSVRN
jgi:3D (Asp-Asp-Asp) domain-containing protein